MSEPCPFCEHLKYTTEYDVGLDIDDQGEERQHLEICQCGAWRFMVERTRFDGHYYRLRSKWKPRDEPCAL